MSRSRKRFSIMRCSKKWYSQLERAFRHMIKRECHEATRGLWVDPDADYEEYWEKVYLSHKKFADWGTWFGYPVPPNPDDCGWDGRKHEWYEKGLRK